MRNIDRHFLTLFKDLKLTPNKINPGTEDKPNYMCYIGKESISHSDVVRLVKQYQDDIIAELLHKGE